MKFGGRDLEIIPLNTGEFLENELSKVYTFVTSIKEITFTRVP